MQQILPITDFYRMNLGICVVSIFITMLSLVLLWTGRKMDPAGTRYLTYTIMFNFNLAIAYVALAYCNVHLNEDIRLILSIAKYAEYILIYAVCFMVVLYLFYLVEKSGFDIAKIRRGVNYLFVILLILPTINLFVPFMYDFTANNVYYEKIPLYFYEAFGLFIMIYIVYTTWKYRKYLNREVTLSVTLLVFLIAIAVVLSTINTTLDLLGFFITIALFIMVLYIEAGMVSRYMKDEKELLSVKTKLLLSQMRPHFLYNALSSISQLCKQDPKQAATMTKHFSEYLSKNLMDLVRSEPIPFEKEIEYIKSYLRIEQLRFGEDMKVYYNIETTDFVVPPMVLQPLLENSIKHGIGVREEGGNLYISSRVCEDGHMITIADNGVGFDVNHTKAMENVEKRVHVGMDSVRNRLKKIPEARFVMKSKPGKGTIALIVIPQAYSEKYLRTVEKTKRAYVQEG